MPAFTESELRAAAKMIAILRACAEGERVNVIAIVAKSFIEERAHEMFYSGDGSPKEGA